MKRSTDRILTTHTGSLPRPSDLLSMMTAAEGGGATDAKQLQTRVRSAVAEVVRQQVHAGVDIVNDGEASKPSYSTYVKDRLTGFNGEADVMAIADLADYPEFGERFARQGVLDTLKRPACTAPITYNNLDAVNRDIADLKAAIAESRPAEAFLTAASPGVISIFLGNHHYKTHEAYLAALADAMKTEYHAIYQAGLILQVDCPDFAMGRHIQFPDATLDEFRRNLALHVEALNHALAGIPEDRVRIHLCWGNYEGPHHRDVPIRDIIDLVFKAHASGISYEGANPRHEHEWAVFKDVKLPAGKVLIPGVIDSTNNYIEHPELIAQRITNLARVVGRENVIAGSDCGFATVAGYTPVDPKITWAKLAAMSDGAKIASQQLW
ncbi:MAG: 5-methyltetrahydropteroyltriglutamate--homocysteine methyltransferase [Candidatus Binataceae bacterium]|jgi:5-methyltetrahydropteroyltriglutamate--homocysteine methyltransferase|nr:5-methyltetrahydropteroyltriglutamate--homocysteine methyltransferase [Candidatus Binataceae bacterium]